MTTTGNPIEAVRARLDGGKRWIKGGLEDAAGNVCLVGALCELDDQTDEASDMFDDAFVLVRDVCEEQYPERVRMLPGRAAEPAFFNDHPDTVWADVDLVLDKASIAWDEAVRP